MSSEDNDVFESIQRKIKYEGFLDEARSHLDLGNYNEAISAAGRAREYLRPESNTSEIDALVSSAEAALSRIEQDAREAAERAEAERKRAAERERLAQEQAAERRRQNEQRALQEKQKAQQDKQREQKARGRLVSTLIIICIIGATAFGIWWYLQKQHEEKYASGIAAIKSGDVTYANSVFEDLSSGFEFGGDAKQGKKLTWKIAKVENGRALLLCTWYVMPKAYNDAEGNVTWESSSIRKWLNSTYIDYYFNSEERQMIVPVILSNPGNEEFGTVGGNDTVDSVFILSTDEIEAYQGIFHSYAHAWARTPGELQDSAMVVEKVPYSVFSSFSMKSYPANAKTDESGNELRVFPALWIDISKL